MVRRDVHRTEGVVEDEHPDARFGAFTQYLAERVGHTSGGAVIQLQGDRPLCRPQVFPQARIGAVTVQHDLDTVAGREPCAGGHRRHEWKLWFADADWGAVCGHATDVANGRTACEMQEPNKGEAEDDNDKRPPTDSAECGDDAALPEGCAGIRCLLQHASPLRLVRPRDNIAGHGGAASARQTTGP